MQIKEENAKNNSHLKMEAMCNRVCVCVCVCKNKHKKKLFLIHLCFDIDLNLS